MAHIAWEKELVERLCKPAGISSLRAVRVVKRALEKGCEIRSVVCTRCKEGLLADQTPDRQLAWDELVKNAGHLGRGPEDLLLELM